MTVGLVLLAGGAAVGLFGSLLGLGGGILLVPLLTLGFGRPLREAVAISLVSVIVTSSAGAGVYLHRHVANLRLGMVLELFTATGALLGGLIAFSLPVPVLQALFAILLTWVAVSMIRRREPARAVAPVLPEPDGVVPGPEDGLATEVAATGGMATASRPSADSGPTTAAGTPFLASLSGPGYAVHSFPVGMAGAVFAGIVSALLGVGGGIVKVPLMNLAMGVPLKVATAT